MENKTVVSIETVIDYIEANLDGKLDLETVAEAVHYSKYHLHRMFTSTVGMTIHDYVQRRQLTEAAKLLAFSDRPIIEVTFICGYESQQAFSSAFKSMYKIPPAEYRDNREFYPLQLRFALHRNVANKVFTKDDICLAEKADIPAWMNLMRYNGINATMQSVVQFGAPAAAAVVLTMSTLRATLLIDILTAVIGIGVFSCILLPKQEKSQEMTSVLADIGVGIRYAHSCMVVRKTLVIYGLFVFLTVPAGYLSGLLVSRVFGDTYWYLTAVELVGFGGMMLGGLLMSIWGGFKSRRLTLATGLSLFGIMAIGMGVSRHFVLYLVLMALYGIALTTVQTTITTMLQENSEVSMQGRVFGLMSSLYSSCYPIGMALFGPLADTIPLKWIMVISGIALITVAGTAYCDRHLKFN